MSRVHLTVQRDIFKATAQFAVELGNLIQLPLFASSPRLALSDYACSLSLEHWTATLTLLEAGLLPSAVVVHRAQFEALLRSVWILYAATEEQLSKLSAQLTIETEQTAKNLPQTLDMMVAIRQKGPPQAYDALNRFKENSWKALNSYAHAGLHPIKRHAEGYPTELMTSVARNANGLAVMSAMQAVVLCGTQPLQRRILELAGQYPDCMPPPL